MKPKVLNYHGMEFLYENTPGTVRSGKSPDGKPWRTVMQHNYGFIDKTEAVDGDEIDVYFPPSGPPDGVPLTNKIFAIHQRRPWDGKYDEDKLMVGYKDRQHAVESYKKHYDTPSKFLGPITEWTAEELKKVLDKSKGKPGKLDEKAKKKWLTSDKVASILREFVSQCHSCNA